MHTPYTLWRDEKFQGGGDKRIANSEQGILIGEGLQLVEQIPHFTIQNSLLVIPYSSVLIFQAFD